MRKNNQAELEQNSKLLKVKSEKGSVTVFVVTTMLFLLMALIISYMGMSNKNSAQSADIKRIKAEYEKQMGDIDQIYEETKAKTMVNIEIECEKEYNIAQGATVTIPAKITLTAEDMSIVSKSEYAWSTSGTTKPSSWTEFTGTSVSVKKENAGKGEYYLWVRITTSSGAKVEQVSDAIIVNEGEITLTPDTTEPTKGPVNVTIDYEKAFTKDRKVGIGKTPEEAKANATLNEKTNLEITENCFIYVTAKDAYGNPGEASLQIDNIDKEKPEITLTPNGGKYKIRDEEKKAISVKVEAKDTGSGLDELKYVWATSNTEKPQDSEYKAITSGETVTSEEYGVGTYYLWVIATDKAGNVAEETSWAYEVTPPAAPTIDLKLNDANGAQYTSGTWTNQNIYADVSLPKDEGTVVKYQYSYNGNNWIDIPGSEPIDVNYNTVFPMSDDGKPTWLGNLTDTENTNNYYMVVEGTTLVPNNKNIHSTQADSYIPIDLTGMGEDVGLKITINAKVSSESGYDYGYAYITEKEEMPNYNGGTGIESLFKIAGSVAEKDYSKTIKGGKVYYLHIGYRKDGSSNSGEDKCTINSIKLEPGKLDDSMNFYEYTQNENTITFKLQDEMEKDFYVKALYEDGTESNVSQFKACIDKTAPVINAISSELVSTIETKIIVSNIVEKASGVRGYYISKEEQAPTVDSQWIEVEGNSFEIESLDVATNYNVWVIDNAGNISTVKTIKTENVNYRIDRTKYSSTLQKALELANDNSTIELLRDYTDSSVATINKNITLDTGDFVLTRTVTTTVSGTTDKPVTLTFNGKITSGGNINTITTSGTSTINGTGTIESTSTNSNYAVVCVNDNAIFTQDGDITVSGYYEGVYNYGTFNLNSGKVESTYNSSGYAIYNYTSGDVTNVYGGEVVGYYGIYNRSSSNTNVYGGKIEGTGNYGIYISSGKLNVEAGEISGKTAGIYAGSSSTTNITGGIIKGNYGIQVYNSSGIINVLEGTIVGSTYGIYGSSTSNGKITIGDINTEVNDKQPVVSGGQYGVYMNSYNFNNGIIMGTNTTPYTETVNPREGYMVYTYYDYNNARKFCAVLTKTVNEITIEHNPTEWTNQDVEVQVRYPIREGTTLEYSEDGENWTEVSNGYKTNVYENKTVYARMLDASGVILQRAEHEITNIDKIAPEVEVTPETTKYTVYDKNGSTVDISLNVTVTDEGGSEIKTAKYGWSDSKESEPSSWTEFTNTTEILKENCGQGTYYLWFDVEDNAGNKSEIEVISYIVDEEKAVAKIGEEYYYTIQEAFNAAGTTPCTVEIIRDTNETAELAENQNIVLELNGNTIGSSTQETPVIINNGTLKIIDSSEEKTGTIENFVGTAIINNGTLTLGENDNVIEDNSPTISGKKIGIKNNNTVNYYDGTIIGKTAVEGEIQDTPQDYGPVGVYENGVTKINLKVISGYVARIEWTYYAELQTAFDACEEKANNTKQTTVHLLKDLVLDNGSTIYLGQNVRFNVNGHTLTSNNNSVITNNGKLEITDLTEEQNGNIYSSVNGTYTNTNTYYKVIYNKAELIMNGGNIATDKHYNYPIYNDDNGIVEVKAGVVSSSISNSVSNNYAYGVYNSKSGIIKVSGGEISSSGSNYAYGIYNAESGIIEVSGGKVSSSISYSGNYNGNFVYGIYNEESGIIEISGGTVSSSSSECHKSYSYGIYNEGSKVIKVIGGLIESSSSPLSNRIGNGISIAYGIYNGGNGTIQVSECTVDSNIAKADFGSGKGTSYGIYNSSSGIIEVREATVNSSSDSYANAYGIYNNGSGAIQIDGGNVSNSGYSNYGIYNNGSGEIEVTRGIINNIGRYQEYGIYNSSSGIIEVSESTVNNNSDINAVSNSEAYGIYNKESGTIEVEKSFVSNETNYAYGIYNNGSGTVKFIDGTVSDDSKYYAYGIYNANNGSVIIGKKKDGTISTISPCIMARHSYIENSGNDYGGYGLNNSKNGRIEFYDGIIQGDTITVVGGIAEIEEGYQIKEDMVDGLNSVCLESKEENYIVKNENTNEEYISLQDAIDSANNNEETRLKLLKSFDLKTEFSIDKNKNIILDLAGYTMTNRYMKIINKGDFVLEDSMGEGKIINQETNIVNEEIGNVKVIGGSVSSTYSSIRYNSAYGIYNSSDEIIELSGGLISCSGREGSAYGIETSGSGTIEVKGGEINSSGGGSAYGIKTSGSGTIEVKGGEINSSSTNNSSYGISNNGSGRIVVSDGEINSSSTNNSSYGISNNGSGRIEVSGGSINSSSSGGSYTSSYGISNHSSGRIEVSGGEINSSSNGYTSAYGIFNSSDGIIKVSEGTISSSSGSSGSAYGIRNLSKGGSLVIGIKGDGIVSTAEPSITATYTGTSSSYGGYGLYNKNGSLYFYDGIVEATTNALAEDTIITEIEENAKEDYPEPYTIYKLSTEEIGVAKIGDTIYSSLQEAIDSVGNDATTIELLRGIRFTKDEEPIVVDSSKNVILDLRGMTITSAIEDAIIQNSGKLKVIDSTEEAKGKIISSNEKTIQNNVGATLELNKITVTTVNKDGSAVYNEGITNIINATIGDSNGKYAIYNCENATLNVNEGTITNIYNIGIANIINLNDSYNYQYSASITNAQNGELNIQDITCNGQITNTDNANITMTGGEITSRYNNGSRYGIYNTSAGNVTITGGTITSSQYSTYSSYGIYSTAGTVNIGTKDGNILEIPEITGETNAIYISGGTLNIYDGTLKGKKSAIEGDITEIEAQSEFVVTEDGGYEKVTLKKVETPLAEASGNTYYSLKEAIESIDGEGTVTILRDGTVAETVDKLNGKTLTIDLKGNALTTYPRITNTGNLKITDTSTEKTGKLKGYKDSPIYNQGQLEILDGTIEGKAYGIYQQTDGSVTLKGGTISGGTYGIHNYSGREIKIEGGTITGSTYGIYNSSSSGVVNITSGNIIENTNGIYTTSGTANISGGTITGNEYGIYNSGATINLTACTINSNTHQIWNEKGTINIPSGEIITTSERLIENQAGATVVIGVQDGNVSRETPLIQAEEYAIDNSKRGTIKFYDGKIRGKSGGLLGVYSYTEEGYTTRTQFEEDGYYADTLAPSGTVTTVAKIGTLQYTSLQSAINSCPEGEETTIVLTNTINSNETYTIEENQNIIIDLNHLGITSSAEITINNQGTLRIIDSSSEQLGKVENTAGKAIVNTGTLILGTKDGVVSRTCPSIIGKSTAIENTGTFNFYDGIVKGAKALEGVSVAERETGYVIEKTTQNSIEQMILTK